MPEQTLPCGLLPDDPLPGNEEQRLRLAAEARLREVERERDKLERKTCGARFDAMAGKLREVEWERDKARASVKRWEDKEANRGHACYLETERAEALERKVKELEAAGVAGGAGVGSTAESRATIRGPLATGGTCALLARTAEPKAPEPAG